MLPLGSQQTLHTEPSALVRTSQISVAPLPPPPEHAELMSPPAPSVHVVQVCPCAASDDCGRA
jgi:hypothetical protein